MFYVKNIPGWERGLRVAMGVLALVLVALNWGASSLVVGGAIIGFMLAMTGLVGFCPMCAMLGRKLDKGH